MGGEPFRSFLPFVIFIFFCFSLLFTNVYKIMLCDIENTFALKLYASDDGFINLQQVKTSRNLMHRNYLIFNNPLVP